MKESVTYIAIHVLSLNNFGFTELFVHDIFNFFAPILLDKI